MSRKTRTENLRQEMMTAAGNRGLLVLRGWKRHEEGPQVIVGRCRGRQELNSGRKVKRDHVTNLGWVPRRVNLNQFCYVCFVQ